MGDESVGQSAGGGFAEKLTGAGGSLGAPPLLHTRAGGRSSVSYSSYRLSEDVTGSRHSSRLPVAEQVYLTEPVTAKRAQFYGFLYTAYTLSHGGYRRVLQ
ncbi:hypothetical protein Bbelb_329750 [Branchiostoma belcheri]|nr:hypothetical protein Bbelb_329750 [Branchiostoma belcheri]